MAQLGVKEEDKNEVMAAIEAAEETLKKPFLSNGLKTLRKGESVEVKMVGGYGKPHKPPFGKKNLTPEEEAQLDTYYMYNFQVIKGVGDIMEGVTYHYDCSITYFKDTIRENPDTGEKKVIKGLLTMTKEGHRIFRITKVHEGKSTQIRNYMFTPLDTL